MSFNIVISFAETAHFFEHGFIQPKYYLPMANGKSMTENIIDTLSVYGKISVILQKDECDKYTLDNFIKNKYPQINIIYIETYTPNILETIITQLSYTLNNDSSLLITSYDQLMDWNIDIQESTIGLVIDATFFWKHGYDFCKNYKSNILEKKDIDYYSFKTPTQYYSYLESKFGSVKKNKLENMTRGWLIGNFTPSILKTDAFEVGYLTHHKGQVWPAHLHKEANEYNILIKGSLLINNETINLGEIFVIPKGMLTHATFLEDCEILCIKVPSNTKDKYCY
jgi:hypothetical protein